MSDTNLPPENAEMANDVPAEETADGGAPPPTSAVEEPAGAEEGAQIGDGQPAMEGFSTEQGHATVEEPPPSLEAAPPIDGQTPQMDAPPPIDGHNPSIDAPPPAEGDPPQMNAHPPMDGESPQMGIPPPTEEHPPQMMPHSMGESAPQLEAPPVMGEQPPHMDTPQTMRDEHAHIGAPPPIDGHPPQMDANPLIDGNPPMDVPPHMGGHPPPMGPPPHMGGHPPMDAPHGVDGHQHHMDASPMDGHQPHMDAPHHMDGHQPHLDGHQPHMDAPHHMDGHQPHMDGPHHMDGHHSHMDPHMGGPPHMEGHHGMPAAHPMRGPPIMDPHQPMEGHQMMDAAPPPVEAPQMLSHAHVNGHTVLDGHPMGAHQGMEAPPQVDGQHLMANPVEGPPVGGAHLSASDPQSLQASMYLRPPPHQVGNEALLHHHHQQHAQGPMDPSSIEGQVALPQAPAGLPLPKQEEPLNVVINDDIILEPITQEGDDDDIIHASHVSGPILTPQQREHLKLLGVATLTIVGIRYYTGVVHPGEFVALRREPQNPYDTNAIRVDNVHGEQVGHVKATQAVAIAPVMDDMERNGGINYGILQLDGTVPSQGDQYNIPLTVEFYGLEQDQEKAKSLVPLLFAQGITVDFTPGSADPQGHPHQSGLATSTVARDWKSSVELDAMFEQQKSMLAQIPPIQPPAQLATALMTHQMTGISWLYYRETFQHSPLFFREVLERGQTVWLSELTNASQTTAPPRVRGGLLCDDMGMGKTVMTLGVILLNPPKDFCYPEGGRTSLPGATPTFSSSSASAGGDAGAAHAAGGAQPGSDPSAGAAPAAAAPTRAEYLEDLLRKPTVSSVKKLTTEQIRSMILDSMVKEATAPASVVATLPRRSREEILRMRKKQLVRVCLERIDRTIISPEEFWSIANGERVLPGAASIAVPPMNPAGAAALPSQNGATGPQPSVVTLIVCPVSVIASWQEEIITHVQPNVLRVEMYHGPNRHQTILPRIQANGVDIVLTSYQTLVSDYNADFGGNPDNENPAKRRKKEGGSGGNGIFDVTLHRIVLDEAHTIRNMSTLVCAACLKLNALHKIGLSGTPIQNRPDDVFPLLSFLGVEPLVGRYDVFRRTILQPIRSGDDSGLTRLRSVLCHFALRRTKESEGIALPQKIVQVTSIDFATGSPHENIYNTLFNSAREAFSAILRGGDESAMKQYMTVLEALLRIRQACCSGLLIPKERLQRAEEVLADVRRRHEQGGVELTAEEGKQLLNKLKGVLLETPEPGGATDIEGETAECAVCLEELPRDQAVILRGCSHVFCQNCIARVAASANGRWCPLCRSPFERTDIISMKAATAAADSSMKPTVSSIASDDDLAASPKVAALLQSVAEMREDEKGVIFSQFTSFLDIIQRALTNAGHAFTRLDGSMNAKERVDAMKRFNADAPLDETMTVPRFILCSLHAAGTGINLTRGNHVFLMDLWWNGAVEDQAMDRVHRIGQTRDVRVVKFIMSGSIEERLLKMQEAKAAMGKGAMERLSPDELRTSRVQALKDLFMIDASTDASATGMMMEGGAMKALI